MTGLQVVDVAALAAGPVCIAVGVAILLGKLPPSGIAEAKDPVRYRVVNGRFAIGIGALIIVAAILRYMLPADLARSAILGIVLGAILPLVLIGTVVVHRMRRR